RKGSRALRPHPASPRALARLCPCSRRNASPARKGPFERARRRAAPERSLQCFLAPPGLAVRIHLEPQMPAALRKRGLREEAIFARRLEGERAVGHAAERMARRSLDLGAGGYTRKLHRQPVIRPPGRYRVPTQGALL